MNNSNWDESKHPRDNEGKFTYKNGGGSSSSEETELERNIRRANILYPSMKDKEEFVVKNNRYKGIELLDATKIKQRPIEEILYPTMTENIKKIEIPRKNAGDYETVQRYLEKKDGRAHWEKPLDEFVLKSPHGMRKHPIYNIEKHHDGIDLKSAVNTPVKTVDDGVVVEAGWKDGYGNYIEIDHGNGLRSFYGHLNKVNVSRGDKVYQGDNIGLSGNTGKSTGPHLHFGVHRDGKSIDPLNLF